MKTYLMLTITCPDRPGIVERITEVIVGHSGNWEESRMAHLGGDFAGIVKISVPETKADDLAASLQELANDQMSIAVKVSQIPSRATDEDFVLCDLKLDGADHEGIVHSVTAYLASHGINVESMDTDVALAPISGTPLFHMQAQIKVPPALPLSELNDNLATIGAELGVDVEVREHNANPEWPTESAG
jgi:glycine cleavage system regulatory protein